VAAHLFRHNKELPMVINELPTLAAARAGDQEAFKQLVEPYLGELQVHCYRFFGSLEDAEDMLQETLLRAWRRLDTYAGRASFRAWLYKIATNVCLDTLDRHRVRSLPNLAQHPAAPPATPGDPLPAAVLDPVWLDPLPDSLLGNAAAEPDAVYEIHESVTLAFLAVLQQLPGRQRAVLILRDVLGFSASETAQILDVTVVAVNSALQRARDTMQAGHKRRAARPADERVAAARLLERYVRAWEAADSEGLVSLLREDAILTMPPLPAWYRGRADIRAFLDGFLFAGRAAGSFRLLPCQANGMPGFALYERDTAGDYRPGAVHLLTLEEGQIAEIHDFLAFDPHLFERLGLPLVADR
jgi:RNA polymerase sigma-70 factor (ECF subfamily)